MKDHKVDPIIEKSLKEGTDSTVNRKEELWDSIQNRLDKIDQQKSIQKSTKKKRWIAITTTAAGIFLAIMLTTTTEQGQAFISHVRQWLEPEKSIEQELEGTIENTDMNLHEREKTSNQEADFAIYVDEERYDVIKENGIFRITAKLTDTYPEVYMDISQQVGINPKAAMDQIQLRLSQEYQQVSEIEQIENPVEGYRIRANSGHQWNDEMVVYYVVSNELEGSFIIKQKYFREAAEGHGARMDQMLKEFYVILN